MIQRGGELVVVTCHTLEFGLYGKMFYLRIRGMRNMQDKIDGSPALQWRIHEKMVEGVPFLMRTQGTQPLEIMVFLHPKCVHKTLRTQHFSRRKFGITAFGNISKSRLVAPGEPIAMNGRVKIIFVRCAFRRR